MERWLNFDHFITPTVIKIIFFIGAGLAILSGLITLFAGPGGFFANLIMGLVTMVLGPILVRVYCELIIVAFKIYENIKELNEKSGP